jgi:squalene-associated FAD-dependent desaturase
VLHFLDRDGRRYDFQAARWLPAPLHLAPSFWRLGFLSLRERLAVGRAMWKLMRLGNFSGADDVSVADWLRASGQSQHTIEQFWAVILVSALGESLSQASLLAARKVIVDGFLASRQAYEIEVPQVPLSEFYGQRLRDWLVERRVALSLGQKVRQVGLNEANQLEVCLADNSKAAFDFVICALPWRQTAGIFAAELQARLAWTGELRQFHAAPITGVHLWFDRPITDLPHAVIVGRLSQWIFSRPAQAGNEDSGTGDPSSHYYQVVISASHDLAGRDKAAVIDQVRQDLAAVLPEARAAKLLSAKLITEPEAVFSVRCGLEQLRPSQGTEVPGLLVAGDWTSTGWPSTMEGAVRSGYLAAEELFKAIGTPRQLLVPELPRSWLARRLIRKR